MASLGRITPIQVPADHAIPGAPEADSTKERSARSDGISNPGAAAGGEPFPETGADTGIDPATLTELHREYLASRIEASVAPPGRVTAILPTVFLALVIAAGLIAWFGRVDIVVSTTGRIVPTGKVKLVQPSMPGTITEIRVAEGDAVAAGQPLVVLDPTEAEAELDLIHRQVDAGELEVARLEALLGLTVLARSDTGVSPVDYFAPPAGVDPALVGAAARRLGGDWRAIVAAADVADREIARLRAAHATLRAEADKLEDVVPILADREASLAHLLDKRLTARSEYLEVRRRLVETQHEARVLDRRIREAEHQIVKAVADREAMLATREAEVMGQLAEQRETLAAALQELIKAADRTRRQVISAPDAGVVTQLSVATVGGVVQAGEALMRLVPTDGALEASVTVPNRDIGFVEAGQRAVVKVDAFNYLRHGTLDGRVAKLSADAVDQRAAARAGAEGGPTDPAAGAGPNGAQGPPSYTATIALDAETLAVDGRTMRPTPGMTVTVDIRTGERRLAEFILQPVLRYAAEGFRER